jgi:hypothetical protein
MPLFADVEPRELPMPPDEPERWHLQKGIPVTNDIMISPSPGAGADEEGQHVARAASAVRCRGTT